MASGRRTLGAKVSEDMAEEVERAADRRDENKSEFVKRAVKQRVRGESAVEEWAKTLGQLFVAVSVFVGVLGAQTALWPTAWSAWQDASVLFAGGCVLAIAVHTGAVARVHRTIGRHL